MAGTKDKFAFRIAQKLAKDVRTPEEVEICGSQLGKRKHKTARKKLRAQRLTKEKRFSLWGPELSPKYLSPLRPIREPSSVIVYNKAGKKPSRQVFISHRRISNLCSIASFFRRGKLCRIHEMVCRAWSSLLVTVQKGEIRDRRINWEDAVVTIVAGKGDGKKQGCLKGPSQCNPADAESLIIPLTRASPPLQPCPFRANPAHCSHPKGLGRDTGAAGTAGGAEAPGQHQGRSSG